MLFQHQTAGAAWLAARTRGYLGDEPGLGKTRTILSALFADPTVLAGKNVIVACPAIVKSHWRAEEAVVRGLMRASRLFVASYEQLTRGGLALMVELLRGDAFGALVLDEAHYLKHPESQRAKLLLGREGYARRIPRVYCASGTPIPRHPAEFWTVGAALFPELMLEYGFRTRADLEAAFCVTRWSFVRGSRRGKVVGTKNEELFREILGRCLLRRTLADVGLDVPAIFYQPLPLDSIEIRDTTDDARIRARLDAGASLEEIANDPHVARYRRRVGELKAHAVVDLLRAELTDSDEQVVVFAHHREVLRLLGEGLAAFGVSYVDGDTPMTARDSQIAWFKTKKTRIFLGQNIACGTGMDGLQGTCRRVILVEPDWTATMNEQLAKRVARLGSSAERVIVQLVALAGTLDDAIVRQNVREAEMQTRMFPGGAA